MSGWQFAAENPVTAIILAIILAHMVVTPIRYAVRAYIRRLRHKNILAHGWPTPPTDADGDVVYQKCEEDEAA